MAALATAKTGWEAEIKASPTFRADYDHARRALTQFGNRELFGIMDETLIGSHPVMFRFMAQVGRALAEPGFRGRGETNKSQKPLSERLWPSTKE